MRFVASGDQNNLLVGEGGFPVEIFREEKNETLHFGTPVAGLTFKIN